MITSLVKVTVDILCNNHKKILTLVTSCTPFKSNDLWYNLSEIANVFSTLCNIHCIPKSYCGCHKFILCVWLGFSSDVCTLSAHATSSLSGLMSGDSGGVCHQFTSFSCNQARVRCVTCFGLLSCMKRQLLSPNLSHRNGSNVSSKFPCRAPS